MIKIFIDFDGTITKGDIGDSFFEKFGGTAATKAVEDYRAGLINATECFDRESAACTFESTDVADEFIDRQKIDPTFINFISFLNQYKNGEKKVEYFIVSDGLDYYITRILRNNGLESVAYFSNHAEFIHDGDQIRLNISYHFTDEECDRCACCKRNHMLSLSADDDVIVYIGEGFSDFCPVKYADIVFAKDELQTYCQRENITFHYYKDFNDIKLRLKEIFGRKRINKRQQAIFNRKDVLMAG
jgi:2-hydroxy-3-keto-5-methylthiopentenyl-1-phosphate phosphatase